MATHVDVQSDISESATDGSDADSSADESGAELGIGEDEAEIEGTEEVKAEKAGLANVFAKILNKSTANKNQQVILAKAKTDLQIELAKRKKEEEEEDEGGESKKAKVETLSERQQREERKIWENMARVKPDVRQKDKERALQRIATKGVVQLFNAVKNQQKVIEEKLKDAGKSTVKKERAMKSVTKGAFLDMLKGSSAKSTDNSAVGTEKNMEVKIEKCEEETPAWDTLREDFMMGGSMKDWDKDSDSDPQS